MKCSVSGLSGVIVTEYNRSRRINLIRKREGRCDGKCQTNTDPYPAYSGKGSPVNSNFRWDDKGGRITALYFRVIRIMGGCVVEREI